MTAKIVECIPNFSEARRPEVVAEVIAAVAAVPGVTVLDRHSDSDHNRTVLTFIGEPQAVEAGAYAGIAKAAEVIDLNTHQGEHPRIGATDVVPFVPIAGVTMVECVEMARRLAKKVSEELNIPVYLYEEAALRQDRRNLEDIRKGEFEGLREVIATDPYREPDYGPKELGPAGATVIGAREPLIAYNIFLTTSDVTIAEKVARRARNSTGGFHFVKAMGVLVDGMAQVSMNLTNYKRSPMAQVTEMIRREAQRYGVGIHHSEIVGLIPNQALINAARWYLQLDGLEADQLLDSRVFAVSAASEEATTTDDRQVFIEQVAEGTPAPGGGSTAAYSGALAAALAVMVARLTVGKAKYAAAEAEAWQVIEKGEALRISLTNGIKRDSDAFNEIMTARKLPKATESEQAARLTAIHDATLQAAQVPLESARKSLEALKLCLRMAEIGNLTAISDAGAGVNLAVAAVRAAGMNVKINLLGLENESEPAAMLAEIKAIQAEAEQKLAEVTRVIAERAGF